MDCPVQPFVQKLIDAGIVHYDDMYEETDGELHVYYIDMEYCIVYEFDDGIEDNLDILVGDIGEHYDDGKFIGYHILPVSENGDDELFVDEIEGHLKIYKRITL